MSCLANAVLLLATLAPLQSESPSDVVTVRSETGEPLQGAEVFALDHEVFMTLVFPFSDTLEGAIEKHGTRLVADAQGAVRVTGSKLLWGRCGDRRGMLNGSPPLPEAFVLAPCVRIAVRVVDGEGRPAAAARVALRGHVGGEVVCHFPVGLTDDAGELAFPHFFPMVDMEIERWSACLAVLGAPPVEAFYDLTAPPAEPLSLVRPPIGALALRAVDERGERIDCGAIQVSASGVDGATRLLTFDEGELRLDEVVLGARFHLLPLPYGDWRGPETEIVGPAQLGEVREHTLAFTSVDRHGLGEVAAPEAGFYRIFVAGQRRVGSVIWSGAWTFTLTLPE